MSTGPAFGWRGGLVAACFVLAGTALLGRALWLQVLDHEFLEGQGASRQQRVVVDPAFRGTITDRNGEALAVSTPVDSLWCIPRQVLAEPRRLAALARVLAIDPATLTRTLTERKDREFTYLRRHVSPQEAQRVLALGVPGVHSQRESRRYYPAGEVTAHVLGSTDVDDLGAEGLELSYDELLRGAPGAKRVVKDLYGNVMAELGQLKAPRHGRDLALSIDLRIQYMAYRELKRAVYENEAVGGSIVVLDATTGEVLAMASQPSWNPNSRAPAAPAVRRNRAATDAFEPGSAFKPFPIAVALETGEWRPRTLIDTKGGMLKVGTTTLRDEKDFGLIDVTTVLTKSVNTGSAQIALSLDRAQLWETLARFGFGSRTGSGFPGEQSGNLPHYQRWRSINTATMSYGYGLSVTTLQLAQAFAVVAADGVRHDLSLVPAHGVVQGERVVSVRTAREMRTMLETVVSTEGTASRAALRGYRVAGKTGTARKIAAGGGYDPDRHRAIFAGMAPATDPRLVTVVVIEEPSKGRYHGGDIAAPVFSDVMQGALRLMDVAPDDLRASGELGDPLLVGGTPAAHASRAAQVKR
jgi:cell division protein FtsI (penicillin-binding protein 3)